MPLAETPEMSHWRGGGLWHLVRETAVVAATNGKFKTSSYSDLELCSIQRPGNVELRPNEQTWCQCIYVLSGVFLYASIAVQNSACQMVSKETLYKIVVYSKRVATWVLIWCSPHNQICGGRFWRGEHFRKNTVRRTLSWEEQSREKKVPFTP